MTHTTETTVTETTVVETAAAPAATSAVVITATPKTTSKKSFAMAIFAEKMVERSQGLFASNKEFRAAVLRKIEAELGVSTASAATMYNAAKEEAEKADATVGLGRDPKKAKVVVEGGAKRGRPANSKNKVAAEVIVVSDATAAVVEGAATETVAEATQEAATA